MRARRSPGKARVLLAVLAVGLCSGLARAQGVPVEEASKAQWRAAQKTFLAADELFDGKRYEEALTAYRASWNIVASPNSRLQMARALRELGRYDEAFQQFQGTIEDATRAAKTDAKKYTPTVEAAQNEMAALERRVARISIALESPPPGTRVTIGEKRYDAEELPPTMIVTAGEQHIVVEVPGQPPIEKQLTLAGGANETVSFDLAKGTADQTSAPPVAPTPAPSPAPSPAPADEGSSLKPYAYVAGGVGIVGLAAFTAFGLMNNSKYSELEDSCPQDQCGASRQEDIDTGKRYQTFANIGLIVGVVGVGVGATLFVLDGGGDERPSARMSVGPGSVQLEGRF